MTFLVRRLQSSYTHSYTHSRTRAPVAALALLALVPAPAVNAQAPATVAAIASLAPPDPLAPFKAGHHFFTRDASGALTVRDGADGAPRVLLPAGSFTVVAPSPDGNFIAYTTAAHGTAGDVHVRDVNKRTDLAEVVHHAIVSSAPWTRNERGFFYAREDTTDHRQRVYYHATGKAEGRDQQIFSQFDHPDWRYDVRVSDDGQYAVFTISAPTTTGTRIYFIDLDDPDHPTLNAPVVRLVDTFASRYAFIDNAGTYFFLATNRTAPRGRIVLANTEITREDRWPNLIAESTDTLIGARTAGDTYLVALYRSHDTTRAQVLGPPDPATARADLRRRLDSLRKERDRERREAQSNGGLGVPGGPNSMMLVSPIRLDPHTDLAIPAGSTIVAMNSVADDSEVFYTVRMSDGTLRSFMYDVKKNRTSPYPVAGR